MKTYVPFGQSRRIIYFLFRHIFSYNTSLLSESVVLQASYSIKEIQQGFLRGYHSWSSDIMLCHKQQMLGHCVTLVNL